MKLNFKFALIFSLFALFCFTSCQDEVVQETPTNQEETLVAGSTLATLIQNTAARDGSFDNIIDFANCLSINLPVTVTVNGTTITVESAEDYDAIEAIIEAFNNDNDEIEIQFPITVTLSDYTEVTIQSEDQLQALVDECNGENEEDDDIECIDFQYPIAFSIYNTDFQVTDVVTINSDEELYAFLSTLGNPNQGGGVLASLNFPVTMVLANGETIEVNNNEELEAAISEAEFDCDEDDDYDWNDDDEYDCEDLQVNIGDVCTTAIGEQGFVTENCGCEVEDTNPFECYEGNDYVLEECNGDTFGFAIFNLTEAFPNCALPAIYGIAYHESLADAQAGVNAISNPEAYQNINTFEQTIYLAITDTNTQEVTVFEVHLIAVDCSTSDCSEQEVHSILLECIWNVVSFNGSNDLIVYDLEFINTDSVVIVGNGQTIDATWSTSINNGNVIIEFQNVGGPNIQAITGNWIVVSCGADRFELESFDNDDTMVLEQDCN